MTNSIGTTIPSWVSTRIGYQCFVDSFSIGDGSIVDKGSIYSRKTYDRESRRLDWDQEFDEYCYGYSYYGGDLQGVARAVDNYLADFGVNMIYMTPIFKAESNHKYDTLDYKQIDPHFGTMDDFEHLLKISHSLDIKIILDGVFNHTSSNHDWYQRAMRGEKPYVDYFRKNKEGYFLKWAGIDTMPLIDHSQPAIRDIFYESDDSIIPYWLNRGADGWRLDVAEGLGKEVIRSIKASIRKRFTDKLLIGEVVDSYGKDWLGPDLLDGVMNYVFLGTTVNFLNNKITGEEYLNELTKMYEQYPQENLYTSWNIISTHDTNRMLFEVGGNENLFKMAVALQFTYPGIPMIYYGDEIGLISGQKDISNRRGMNWEAIDLLKLKAREPWKPVIPMDWKRVNQYSSFYFYYKHLIWLRKNMPVLTHGEFIPLYADKTCVCYLRRLDDKIAFVLINNGENRDVRIPVPERIRRLKPELKRGHGPLNSIDLTGDTLDIHAYAQNTYIYL
ncbi:glycoside hydrolase family 13 protein [candidate division KSB1 bacterium]|nr:glycoside hydrolase family 13 protein [candidate division KSB1 bacterium]